MIKIAERDKDYLYIYSEDPTEIEYLKRRTKMVFEEYYNNCPAIVVKKEKNKKHIR